MQTKKFVVDNMFADNNCLMFDRAKASQMTDVVPPLAAICLVNSEPQLPRELELLDKACVENVTPLLFANERLSKNYKVWLFLAHGPWQAKSVMVKHRKLWKSFPSAWQMDAFRLCEELTVESHEGLRFTGVGEITQQGLFTATQILRRESSGAIVLSERDYCESEDSVMHFFNSAFPSRDGVAETRVDWLNLALHCCPLNDIVIRVSGSWDEREASIDLIMLPEHLPRFNR